MIIRRNACGRSYWARRITDARSRRVKLTEPRDGYRRRRESPSSRLYPARLPSIKVLSGVVNRLSTAFGAGMAIIPEGASQQNRAGMPAKRLFRRGMRTRGVGRGVPRINPRSCSRPVRSLQKSGEIRPARPQGRRLTLPRRRATMPATRYRSGRSPPASRSPQCRDRPVRAPRPHRRRGPSPRARARHGL